jgi:hypothetical protein
VDHFQVLHFGQTRVPAMILDDQILHAPQTREIKRRAFSGQPKEAKLIQRIELSNVPQSDIPKLKAGDSRKLSEAVHICVIELRRPSENARNVARKYLVDTQLKAIGLKSNCWTTWSITPI